MPTSLWNLGLVLYCAFLQDSIIHKIKNLINFNKCYKLNDDALDECE